jgi:cob(I)alamin adenosyltransferase
MNTDKGLIYIFTGDGKGKTSAALGVTLRALLGKRKVCWISWYKEKSWQMSEQSLSEAFPENFEMHLMGKGFYMKDTARVEEIELKDKKIKKAKVNSAAVYDTATVVEHMDSANDAIKLAGEKIGEVWLLVLDEVLNAIDDNLLTFGELESLLKKRGSTNIVMTGRSNDNRILELADLVSRIEKVKHPYDRGVLAVKGLDF